MKKLLALAFVFFASPASATIVLTSTGSTIGSSNPVTLSSVTIPSGSLILNAIVSNSGSPAIACSNLTDSASNTYLAALTSAVQVPSSSRFIQLCYAYNSTALSSGTISYSNPSSVTIAMSIGYASGANITSSVLDQKGFATALATTTCSAGALTPTVAGELFIGVSTTATAAVITQAAGFNSTLPSRSVTLSLSVGDLVDSGTTAETYAPTRSTNTNWACLLASFKPVTTTNNFILSPSVIP